jgi:hypothetical protein
MLPACSCCSFMARLTSSSPDEWCGADPQVKMQPVLAGRRLKGRDGQQPRTGPGRVSHRRPGLTHAASRPREILPARVASWRRVHHVTQHRCPESRQPLRTGTVNRHPESSHHQAIILRRRVRSDPAINSPPAARLRARDLPSAIAPDAGRTRRTRPVPPWPTRRRPAPHPAAGSARRSPATAHRSPNRARDRPLHRHIPDGRPDPAGHHGETPGRLDQPGLPGPCRSQHPRLPVRRVLIPDRHGKRATALAGRHRQRRDVRLGQQRLLIAYRQANHLPSIGTGTDNLACPADQPA